METCSRTCPNKDCPVSPNIPELIAKTEELKAQSSNPSQLEFLSKLGITLSVMEIRCSGGDPLFKREVRRLLTEARIYRITEPYFEEALESIGVPGSPKRTVRHRLTNASAFR